MFGERICVARETELWAQDSSLSTVWVSTRGRLWKCAREQIREATNHESLGAGQLHDHLWQLLTDARSPQTLTEAVDVSVESSPEGDQSQGHPDAHPTNESKTQNQQPTAIASSPIENSEPEIPPGLGVPAPRVGQLDCLNRTLERDHARRCRLPKPDPFITKAISSANLHNGAASI